MIGLAFALAAIGALGAAAAWFADHSRALDFLDGDA